CGESLYGHPCRWCTCERCGNDLRDGYCFLCHSRNGDSFTSTSNSFDNPPDFSFPPPQPQYMPYSCELCGNDAHYGYDCPPQVPFVYNQDPCFNQNFDYFPQTSPSFPQQYPCCEDCGGPHETFQCQPMNYYEPNPCYDSNYSGFDQFELPQFPVIHQPIREKTCAELLAKERAANINTQPMQYSVVHQMPQEETSLEFLQDQRNLINSVQTFLRKFKRFSFYETPKVISLSWETISEIERAFKDKQYQPEAILELFRKLHDDVQNIHEELAEYINTPNWNRPIVYYDDDDDEESSIPLKDIIISGLPPCVAITPVLATEEPVDSLIMEDEHLDTILATELDEVIKSSVEILVPILSESEGIPDKMCDVPFHDNSPPLDISKDQFEDFSDSNDDSTSIDDDSFSIDDIDYVEASPPNFKLVSLEEVKDFHTKDGEIEDDILREILSKINLLIAKIKAINSNPPPSSNFVTKSPSTFPNSFFEETNTFDNSIPESETFCFDLEENSSDSTTTRSDYSLPDYEAFYFDDDHIKEKSSGSTTTHSDISLSKYDSFIFDLSNDPFPPADRSDFYHEEFADELAHIISPRRLPRFLKPLVLTVLSFDHSSFTSSALFGNPIS
ncbi:hypothetical protein Tco_0383392, partial [Tanacetum coccineum]